MNNENEMYERGYRDGKWQAIFSLYIRNKIDKSTACKYLRCSVEEFNNFVENKQREHQLTIQDELIYMPLEELKKQPEVMVVEVKGRVRR